MNRRRGLIAVGAVLALGLAAGTPTAAAMGRAIGGNASSHADRVTDLPELQVGVLAAVNDFRRAHGLPPLKASSALAAAAREQSVSMAEHGFFSHTSFGGSPFWKRVETKYPRPAGGGWRVGENLVWRSPWLTAQRALELWLESPPHRENLLRAVWREIGISAVHAASAPGVYDGLDVTILTADFGVRR